jgi:hypothetical protein
MTFFAFLLGCWLGCLSGFFLAHVLKGSTKSEKFTAEIDRINHDAPNSALIR